MPEREANRYWKQQHRNPRLVTDNLDIEFFWCDVSYSLRNNIINHLIPGASEAVVQHIAKAPDEITAVGVFLDREHLGERDSYSRIEELRQELSRIPEKPYRFTMPFGRENFPVYVSSFRFNHNTGRFGGVDFVLNLRVVSNEGGVAAGIKTLDRESLIDQTTFDENTLPPLTDPFQTQLPQPVLTPGAMLLPTNRELTESNLPNIAILRAERLIERPQTPKQANSLIRTIDGMTKRIDDIGRVFKDDGVESFERLRGITGDFADLAESAVELINSSRELSINVTKMIDNIETGNDPASLLRLLTGLGAEFLGDDHPVVQLAGMALVIKQVRTLIETDLPDLDFDRNEMRLYVGELGGHITTLTDKLATREPGERALKSLYAWLDEISPNLAVRVNRRSSSPVPAIVLAYREFGSTDRRSELPFTASPALIRDYSVRR